MASRSQSPHRLPCLVAAVAVAACSAGASGSPRIRIELAEARLSPMLVGVCSIFMTIANPGTGDDALVEARADVAGAITEIHAVQDGRMVQRSRLVVPAGGALQLQPGGLHIMVFNLPKDSGAGYEFTLRLRFEKSGEMRTSVRIDG